MLVLLVLFMAGMVAPFACAQVSTGEISGVVTDQSAAVVAGAKVTAGNRETGASRQTATSADGSYVMTLLPPGDYDISVEAPGFRRLLRQNVQLQVNQRLRLDVVLEVGQTTETLQITGAPPLLESQSSAIGSVIPERFVNQLPLNGRNFVQLAILSPGVSGVGFNTTGTIMSGTRPDDRRPGTEVFSNGNREGSNNFLYDGVDNNDRYTLSIVLRPAVEAVREFKVQTNLYSADLGRNSGAIVDVITKSGTNQFHGSMFEFLRNSSMDARNFYNRRGTPFPAFRFNQFGFSMGGPVLIPKLYNGRNRTFFFVDYEGYRRDSLQSFQSTVPSLEMRRGDFSGVNRIFDPLTTRANPAGAGFIRDQFPNNQIPASRFDAVTAKLINAYPAPQNSGRFNNFLVNNTLRQNWNQGDVRVDHQFSPSDTFFARWSIQHTETITPHTFPAVSIPGLPKPTGLSNEDSFAGTAFQPVHHAVLNYVRVFSPRLINEFRAGFNRFRMNATAEGHEPGINLGNALGVPNSNTSPLQSVLPIFSPANYGGAGASRTMPILRFINTFHYVDNVTYTQGKHTLKFGADFRRRQLTDYGVNRGTGRFNFNPAFTNLPGVGNTGDTMASFLLGYPTLIEKDWLLAWVGVRGLESGLYVADDFRVHRRLTLNLGLRWEYYSPFSEVANRWAFFDADTATVRIAGQDGVDKRVGLRRNFRDLAPRFGFAWQLRQNTVLRGGYGIFYNPGGALNAYLRGHRHLPYGPIYSVPPGDINVGQRVSDGFPVEPALNLGLARNPTGAVVGVFPGFRSGYAQQYNLSVQQEIAPWRTIVKLAYVGNLGRRLASNIDLNQPVPGATSVASRRPFFSVRPALAAVTYAQSDGLSGYHSFQLSVEKRMSHGLGFLVGYAWGHVIENVGTEYGGGTGAPQDIRNRRADRGNASYDLRHRMTVSYLYDLPFGNGRALLSQGGLTHWVFGGWQTNGIATFQTGLPFTPMLQTPTTNCCASRPNRVDSGALSSSERTLVRWFDPRAFTTPALYTFGNAGRNILFGPGRVNFDVSLFKDFPIRETIKIQFRTEAFNVFNTPQFGLPNASIGNPQAGVISSTVGNPRQLQLALRLEF
jgi:hypothetical protein